MIILRSPKGWTGPAEVDGVKVTGTWRSHQVPLSGVRENPEHLRLLESGCAPTVPTSSSMPTVRQPSWCWPRIRRVSCG